MPRFNGKLLRQADEVQTVRELNKRSAVIREQNTQRRAERRPEMIQEGRIQARGISSTHQRESRTRRAQRFVGTAIGEFEVVQEQVHHRQPPAGEEICQFCQAVKWKDETANSRCRDEKGVLTQLHDPTQRV
jgi:hypothetical protein